MSKELLVVLKKELKRVFSDKRMVFTTFILPAISIALIYSVMGIMLSKYIDDVDSHIPEVYIQNNTEEFNKIIKNNDIEINIVDVKDNEDVELIKKDILEGKKELLIIFEKDFKSNIEKYKSVERPNILTFYNPSEEYSNKIMKIFNNEIFDEYSDKIMASRLGSKDYIKPFNINKDNKNNKLVDNKKATGKDLGNLFPVLISIFLFSGAMGVGMDSIAGEKERGTMATLLVTPVKREVIALGKIISLGVVAFISTLSSFIGIIISMPFSSMIFKSSGNSDEVLSVISLGFGFKELVILMFIMITLVGVFVAIISMISVYAKSVKEAGTYISPVYMIIMVAGFSTMFSNSDINLWQYMIPVYGSVLGMKGLLNYDITTFEIITNLISNILFTSILIYIIKNLFNDERVMFNS